ncbi:MAG: DEAD/DEAH box helicase family protein, partial [Clostridia bacterium]|nr:DEAD/DEAH box helicase family protein [Clostridia bacterium]
WKIKNKSLDDSSVNATVTYGTSRASAYRILEDSLNLRDVRIYDIERDPEGRETRKLNSEETTLAQQKQQVIKDKFREWIFEDPDRRRYYVRKYNDLFNSDRPREYNGEHLTLGGMNPEIRLRDHQRNAVAHILYGGNTLLAHEVGAGKTYEMAAACMESKRLGLSTKALFAVPNHLTEQWASEFLRLYPSANILVTTKKDFEPANRKKFCARIATGSYDAIIMGHSQFEKIPMSQERQEALLRQQIREIEDGIEDLKRSRGERSSIKDLERTRKSLEAKLEKLLDKPRDDVVTFEQLGVDRLFVDEAHNYKNLFLYTKMRNVAGLSTTDAQKSSDMYLKCRYLDEITGGKGVIFATGTPVSNSMTELYTMMRYLQHNMLERKGLSHFDSWAATFGETQTAIELAPEGTGYRARTRFAKFFNLPELMNLFKEAADIKTSDQLHLPVPEAEFHNIVAKPTEIQQEMVKELSRRASAVHSRQVDPKTDNMLAITSDGRKLGLDQRIINPNLPDDPGSKVNLCVNNVFRIWEEGMPDKLTQLVFCDLSTPKKAPAPPKPTRIDDPELHAVETAADRIAEPEEAPFSVYDDIRAKLISRGVPAEEIAFIHEADTEVKKKELFAKVRNGTVRVLIGSTSKMGAGTNCQDRLIALHDLDCPWRPGDLEQRKGRIVRQGNRNPKVHIFRYVTEGTFDAYLWQVIEKKQQFISQVMTSKSPVRACDDIDEATLSYAEVKALCAGDPRIKEKMDLDIEVARLKLLEGNHRSQQYRLQDDISMYYPNKIARTEKVIAALERDRETAAAHPHPKDGFAGMVVKGQAYPDRDGAGAALLEARKDATGPEEVKIGTYRGFEMSVMLVNFGKDYILTLHGEMSYKMEMGSDPRGNLIRLDNALNGIPNKITVEQKTLEDTRAELETAKGELGKPFPQAEELAAKSARLAELNAALNIDGRSAAEPAVATTPDEVTKAKPSVMERIQELKAQIRNPEAGPKRRSEQVI